MVEPSLSGGASVPSICPWCSASYTGEPERCPSCGAALTTDPTVDPSLPGLTAIDAAAIVRAKTPTQRPRNRLLSWISGEYPESEGGPGDPAALAPPDTAVRREMLRLELEAEVANLQAEAEALRAEAVVEGRAPDADPEDAAAAEALARELEQVSQELEQAEGALDHDPLVVAKGEAPGLEDVTEGPALGDSRPA
jgi:hypothetical protein